MNFILNNGVLRRTGLNIPLTLKSRRLGYEISGGPIWTKDQIKEVLAERKPRQEIWPFDKFVKDQNGIGACAGYAAAHCLERTRYLSGLGYVRLSGDAVYAACNGGQDRGATLESTMNFIVDRGAPPFDMVDRYQWRESRISDKAWAEGAKYKAPECYTIDSEHELASALAAGFLAVVAVHAGGGGREPSDTFVPGPGNHAVCLEDVRFDSRDNFEFQLVNSWGKWGHEGRAWINWKRALETCTKYHRFYALRSTTVS